MSSLVAVVFVAIFIAVGIAAVVGYILLAHVLLRGRFARTGVADKPALAMSAAPAPQPVR